MPGDLKRSFLILIVTSLAMSLTSCADEGDVEETDRQLLRAGTAIVPQPSDLEAMGTPPVYYEADLTENLVNLGISTATEFAEAYPARTERLLMSLDLTTPGLETAEQAFSSGDLIGAAEAVSAYYRTIDHGDWLKTSTTVHNPGDYFDTPAEGNEVLDDVYTFQGVTGAIVREEDGTVDWLDYGPKGDWQWAVFLNRHFHLIPVLKAYEVDPKPEYAAIVDQTIKDWVIKNYPPEEAATDKKLGANWKPMGTASRFLQVWPQMFYYLQEDPAFTDAGRLMMLSSVPEQAEHLLRYHRRKHNHAIKEMIGLAHAATAWPEFKDAAMWRDYALEVLEGELDFQIYPDGVQKELSAHYHRTVLTYLMQYVQFSRASGYPTPDEFEARIEDMGEYLAWAARPDGHVPLNNNADRDDVREIVRTLADIFDHDDWRYIISNGAEGVAPAGNPSRYWGYAGQLISRSGWGADADWSFFDASPWGISHQHNDKLHLSIASGGRDLLVDTGRYTYKRDDPVRLYVLSTAGHNTVLVDGKNQNDQSILENATPQTGNHAVEEDFSFAWAAFTDGYAGLEGEAVHHRGVAYINDVGWLVADYVETDRPRLLTANWHAHPDVSFTPEGLNMVSADEGVGNIRVTPVGLPEAAKLRTYRGQQDPHIGWYSRKYNDKAPTTVARYEFPADENFAWGWVFTTQMGSAPAIVDVKRETSPDGTVHLAGTLEGKPFEAVFSFTDEAVTLGNGYLVRAQFAMTHDDKLLVANGSVWDADGNIRASHGVN